MMRSHTDLRHRKISGKQRKELILRGAERNFQGRSDQTEQRFCGGSMKRCQTHLVSMQLAPAWDLPSSLDKVATSYHGVPAVVPWHWGLWLKENLYFLVSWRPSIKPRITWSNRNILRVTKLGYMCNIKISRGCIKYWRWSSKFILICFILPNIKYNFKYKQINEIF